MDRDISQFGTITNTSSGYVLVTAAGVIHLNCDTLNLSEWKDQFALVRGKWLFDNSLFVHDVCEMMTPRQLDECASFILAQHGPTAERHAEERLSQALSRNDGRDIRIWTSICRRLAALKQAEPWPKQR